MDEPTKKLLNRAENLCTRSEKCSKQINEKLVNWGASEFQIDLILGLLIEANFIDNKRFAMAYATEKINLSRWGKLKVEKALYLYGIQDEYINIALNTINQNSYEENIIFLISKKRSLSKAKNLFEMKQKVYKYLIRRGFEPELIRKFMEYS